MRPCEPSQLNMLEPYRPPCPRCGGLTALARIEPDEETRLCCVHSNATHVGHPRS
jgi:hypothetical protein